MAGAGEEPTDEESPDAVTAGGRVGGIRLDAERLASLDAGRIAALAVAALAAAVALVAATEVFPYRSLNHDEGVYLQQADMLLAGRLFLEPPVETAFRPWFFIEGDRGLYSKYQPVPAAVFALGGALGWYPLALAGISAGLAAGVVALGRELFDARTGVLAGLLLVASPLFVVHAGVFLPYAVTTALNVAFAVWYLRGERLASRRAAALAGAAVGLAFFARPYTAVLFAAPFVLHAVGSLARARAWRALPVGAPPSDGPAVRELLVRRSLTAGLGTAGVLSSLGYNVLVTGAPLRFPYLVFAPEDGVGFGHREILGHEVEYTLELGIEANRLVLETLFTEWVVAGTLGAGAALAGVAYALGRPGLPRSARVRRGLLAGTVLTVAAGNVAFWGNYNVLGALSAPDDGLVHFLGPYYHYDLLVPTAVFAAVAVVAVTDRALAAGGALARADAGPLGRVGRREGRALAAAVLLVAAAASGSVAVGAVEEPIERNAAVTAEYDRGYAPFTDGGTAVQGPANALVFLPTVYGPWLNHPFQRLRNDPGYDGRTVYALGDIDELEVAASFPDRRLFRYVHRGSWVPTDESTVTADLRRVRRVDGETLRLTATLGRPPDAGGATVRVETDAGTTYLVANDSGGPLTVTATVSEGTVRIGGPGLVPAGGDGTVELEARDEVHIEVFVPTGGASGTTYRVVFPVASADGAVRALSPTVERCPVPTRCAPAGLGDSPPDRFARVRLASVSQDANENASVRELNTDIDATLGAGGTRPR